MYIWNINKLVMALQAGIITGQTKEKISDNFLGTSCSYSVFTARSL